MFQISIYTDDWHTIFGEGETGIINPVMTQKLNGCGSLEFKVPVSDTYYDNYTQFKTRVMVSENGALLFLGRLLEVNKDFNSTKDLIFEGEMALLNDVQYPPYEYSGTIAGLFTQVLEYYNSRCTQGNSINVGRITVTDSNNYIARSNENYSSCWECLSSKLIDLCGGYMQLRWTIVDNVIYRYLDYLENPGAISSQSIEFGENILNITQELSGADIVTVLIPFGAKDETTGERINITSVNPTGKNYIVSSKYEQYGLIEAVEYWDDVTLPQNLYNKALAYLAEHDFSINTLTVNAVDLHVVDEDIARLNVGDTVTVKSTPHGINTAMLITERKRNLDDPSKDTFTIGNQEKTFTSEVDKNNYGTFAVEGDAISEVDILYGNSDSTTTEPTEWSSTAVIEEGKYLWQKTKTTYVSGSVVYSKASCIGGKGNDGKGISSIIEEYYLSTSQTEQIGGKWTTESVVWESGKYIWTRSHIYWSDSTDTTTSPVLANGLNSMGEKIVAVEAKIPSEDDIKSISEQQTEIMLGGSGGYLEILLNKDGKPEGLRVMDSEKESEAINVWLFNKNGFGFSNTGVNGPYYNAWTIDGNLTADHMTTGTLKDKTGNFVLNLDTGVLTVEKLTLDTPDLIFGELNNKYIEVKNYYDDITLHYVYPNASNSYLISSLSARDNSLYKIRFMPTDVITDQVIFGYTRYMDKLCKFYVEISNGVLSVNTTKGTLSLSGLKVNTLYDLTIDCDEGTIELTDVDAGTSISATGTIGDSSMDGVPLYLFALNDCDTYVTDYFYSGRIYFVKIWDSKGELIGNLYGYTLSDSIIFVNDINGTKEALTATGEFSGEYDKVGVLFDGTGKIQMKPEGEFDVSNYYKNVMYNQIHMEYSNDTDGNVIVLSNFNSEGNISNLQKFVGSGNHSTYGTSNYLEENNYCYDDSSIIANYINLISTSTDTSKGDNENLLFLWNNKYKSSSSANSLTLKSLSSVNSFNIFNYEQAREYVANYIEGSASTTKHGLSIYNYIKDDSSSSADVANSILMESTGQSSNSIKLTNYHLSARFSDAIAPCNRITMDPSSGVIIENGDWVSSSNRYRTNENGISIYNSDFNLSSIDDMRVMAKGIMYFGCTNVGNNLVKMYSSDTSKLEGCMSFCATNGYYCYSLGHVYEIRPMSDGYVHAIEIKQGQQTAQNYYNFVDYNAW